MQLLLPNQETTGRMFISLFAFAFPHVNNQVKWKKGFWTWLAYMINMQHLDSTVHNQSTCSHALAFRKFLEFKKKKNNGLGGVLHLTCRWKKILVEILPLYY
jgi:hypothetical protein